MSEDEGHSQGDADSDADDDGDLVSVNATCMQCKQQLECIFIIIAISLAVGLLGLPYGGEISTLAAFLLRNCISVDAANPPWSFFTTSFGNGKAKVSQDYQGIQYLYESDCLTV